MTDERTKIQRTVLYKAIEMVFLGGIHNIFTKTPHDMSKPCISSIATVFLQITCLMVWISCRGDSAPSALRSLSLLTKRPPPLFFSFPTDGAICIGWNTTHYFLSGKRCFSIIPVLPYHLLLLRSFLELNIFTPFMGKARWSLYLFNSSCLQL